MQKSRYSIQILLIYSLLGTFLVNTECLSQSLRKNQSLDTSNILIKYPKDWTKGTSYGDVFLKYNVTKDLPCPFKTYSFFGYSGGDSYDSSKVILTYNKNTLKGSYKAVFRDSIVLTMGNFILSDIFIDSTKINDPFLYRIFLRDSVWTQLSFWDKLVYKDTYKKEELVYHGIYDLENNLIYGGAFKNKKKNGEWIDYLPNDNDHYLIYFFQNGREIYFQKGSLSTNKIIFEEFLQMDKDPIRLEGDGNEITFWYKKNYNESGQIESEGHYMYTITESGEFSQPTFSCVPYGMHKVLGKDGEIHKKTYAPLPKEIKYTVITTDNKGEEVIKTYIKKIN